MKQFKDYKDAYQQAIKLFNKLRNSCTTITICENYGQREISLFKDALNMNDNISYSQKSDIMNILYKVSELTPIR